MPRRNLRTSHPDAPTPRQLLYGHRYHILNLIGGILIGLAAGIQSPQKKRYAPSVTVCSDHINKAIVDAFADRPAEANEGIITVSSNSWFYSYPDGRPSVTSVNFTQWRPENFNLSRCCGGFKVYLYPVEIHSDQWKLGMDVKIDPGWLFYSGPLKIWAAKNRHKTTTNPEEACVLIPSATPSHSLKKCSLPHCDRWPVGQWLRRLEHWDNGRNHIIFDQEDMRDIEDSGRRVGPDGELQENRLAKYATFDVGKAMAIHNSAASRGVRQGFDIPYLRIWDDSDMYAGREARSRVNRSKLACLNGLYFDTMALAKQRKAVHDLHDGKDIFVETGNHNSGDWKETFADCKFGLLPPGGSTTRSFRFLEVLSAGCVPVIVNINGMLPYEQFIDWEALGVVIEEAEIFQIRQIMMEVTPLEYERKRQRVVQLYETMFSTPEKTIDTTLRFVQDEVANALRQHSREVCSAL